MTPGHRKLDDAVRLMRARGFDGLVVYSDGTCNILRASYLHYFSEVAPMGSHNAAVVSSDGRVALLVQPVWDAGCARRRSWIEDVRGVADFLGALSDALRRLEIAGTVGLAGGRQMPHPVHAAIGRGVVLTPADDLIEVMARPKSQEELALV
jgi:hypothetical protein